MPGKEAAVEVETNGVVPEPVTKEIPKCESASKELKADKTPDDLAAQKLTETARVAEPEESKPQDTEISSSEEQKPAEEKIPDKTEKSDVVDSINGSGAEPEEKTVVTSVEESAANGKSKDESPEADVTEAVESSAEPPKAVESEAAKPESSEDSKTEVAMESDGAKSSEAAAKPLPSDDEKMVVEKTTEVSADVSGSDEAKTDVKAETENKENGSASADSSTEKLPAGSDKTDEKATENPYSSVTSDEKPGSSSVAVEPDVETQIAELKKKGVALYIGRDYCAAADTFGKVLEMAAPVYGEMSEKLAETYYMYGTSMFEFGKDQNDVLGEKVKEKDEEGDEEASEEMDVDGEAEPADSAEKKTEEDATPEDAKEEDQDDPADETIAGEEKEDDEDDAFRVSWEMLELAKATFKKADNKKRLADTLMKLGDVGIETGNADAVGEMVEGLEVRKAVFPSNHRIIPETHFKIGVAYAYFEKYDDAIQHFTDAKDCLEKRIEELAKSETKEDREEVEEMKSILPEIQEKIQDTKESKADKEKIKSTVGDKTEEPAPTPFPAASDDKPVSNISHLVKRKRKVDEILPERAAKQSRQDTDEVVGSKAEPEETKKEAETPEETKTEEKVDKKPPSDEAKPVKEVDKSEEQIEAKPEKEEPSKPEQSEETVKTDEAKPAEAKSDEPEKMEE